jgi:predicted amidophosphoribosyltransferase
MSECERCDAAGKDPKYEHCPACYAHIEGEPDECPECGEPL